MNSAQQCAQLTKQGDKRERGSSEGVKTTRRTGTRDTVSSGADNIEKIRYSEFNVKRCKPEERQDGRGQGRHGREIEGAEEGGTRAHGGTRDEVRAGRKWGDAATKTRPQRTEENRG